MKIRFRALVSVILLLAASGPALADDLSPGAADLRAACRHLEHAVNAPMLANGESPESLEEDAVYRLEIFAEATLEDAQPSPDAEPGPYTDWVNCLLKRRVQQLSGGSEPPSRGPGGASASSLIEGAGVGQSAERRDGEEGVAANCDLQLGETHTGDLSTESAILKNGCAAGVSYVYCVEGADDEGAFSCSRQKFGSGWVAEGGQSAISVMGAKSPMEVHWGFCVASTSTPHPLAVRARWDGDRVQFVCH